MSCGRVRQVLDAWVDGELDSETSAELRRHAETCPACAAAEAERVTLRRTLRGSMPYYSAPPELHARVRQSNASRAPEERSPRSVSWWQAAGLAAAAAFLSVLATYWMTKPAADDPLREQLVASHVASLADPKRLLDVEASERHVVKPWFQGKVDFAPSVPDLSSHGYVLLGARVDHVGEKQAAAIVYKVRAHVINVFVWRANVQSTALMEASSRGFSVASWTEDGLRYSAIGDVDSRELQRFATLLRKR
jgi:anti-sigma factor (TIGR02949 family)